MRKKPYQRQQGADGQRSLLQGAAVALSAPGLLLLSLFLYLNQMRS